MAILITHKKNFLFVVANCEVICVDDKIYAENEFVTDTDDITHVVSNEPGISGNLSDIEDTYAINTFGDLLHLRSRLNPAIGYSYVLDKKLTTPELKVYMQKNFTC
jgi:hypothetical protein